MPQIGVRTVCIPHNGDLPFTDVHRVHVTSPGPQVPQGGVSVAVGCEGAGSAPIRAAVPATRAGYCAVCTACVWFGGACSA